jgi:hypothetical protein
MHRIQSPKFHRIDASGTTRDAIKVVCTFDGLSDTLNFMHTFSRARSDNENINRSLIIVSFLNATFKVFPRRVAFENRKLSINTNEEDSGLNLFYAPGVSCRQNTRHFTAISFDRLLCFACVSAAFCR